MPVCTKSNLTSDNVTSYLPVRNRFPKISIEQGSPWKPIKLMSRTTLRFNKRLKMLWTAEILTVFSIVPLSFYKIYQLFFFFTLNEFVTTFRDRQAKNQRPVAWYKRPNNKTIRTEYSFNPESQIASRKTKITATNVWGVPNPLQAILSWRGPWF